MNPNKYKFDAMLWRTEYGTSAYVIFPGDIKRVFGKGIVYVHATVDDLEYDCCILNRGHKHHKNRPTYTMNVNKEMLARLGKIWGDTVTVTVKERAEESKMELLDLMMIRRSIRKYTGEEIPQEKLDAIIQAGLMSFSGRDLKPWEFIIIKEKDTLEKLSHAKDAGSAMLAGADCAIVVIGDREKTDVWTEDCSIAMTYMHLMAAKQGVGSCWVQCRLRNDENGGSTEDYVRELLSIPENYGVEAMLSLGMAAHEVRPHKAAEIDSNKIHREFF